MTQKSERSATLFREVFLVFGAVLAGIIALSIISIFIPFLQSYLYAVVAVIFFLVALRMIERRGFPHEAFGIGKGPFAVQVGWGLLLTLVTLPFFAVGFWLWETRFQDRTFSLDMDGYQQWPAALEGQAVRGDTEEGVWIHSQGPTLFIHMQGDVQIVISYSGADAVDHRKWGDLRLIDHDGTLRLKSSGRGRATIRGPTSVTLESADTSIFLGREGAEAKTGKTFTRGYLWILLWSATQLLLIALPEEYFYRGYVQTRLLQACEARGAEKGKPVAGIKLWGPPVVITSALFGLGHLLVPISGMWLAQRASVFFPSLVFGWLRHKTGSVTGPIVYHAACNMMVIIAAVHFHP